MNSLLNLLKNYAHIIIPEGGSNHVAVDLLTTKSKVSLMNRENLRENASIFNIFML